MKKKLFTLLTLLLCLCSGAWADSKEFVAGTDTGQFSQNTEITDGPVTLKTLSIGGNANNRQIWMDGTTAKNETAVQLSSGAGNEPASKFIEVSVSEGYKITGLTIRGASNGTDNTKVTFKGFCFSGAYSDAVGGITAVGDLVFPLKTGTSSDAANVSMTGIAENTRTIRIYKNVKYNSTTMQMGNVSGASSTPSAENLNVAKITVTYAPTATQYAITWANGGHGTAPTTPTSASVFTLPTMDDADGYKNTGWTANQVVTVGGVEQAAGTELAVGTSVTLSAATTFTGVWTALATNITVTFDKGDGEGIAPAALTDQTEETEITLPQNFTMYKEGYTLTGWNDGVNTYAPGASYTIPATDVTLTAVYTANTKTLADRTATTTIKWEFSQSKGVPAISLAYGGTKTGFVVAQATIAGETIDVKLSIDASAYDAEDESKRGKFANSANTWTQVGPGTIFTIPAIEGATISYYMYDSGATSTPDVQATGDTYELTAEGTNGNLYYEYIQVVIPKEMINPASGEIFKLNMTYSGSNVNVSHGTEAPLGSYGTATSGCDVVIGNKHGSDDSKARFTSDGIYFGGSDAYIKIDFNFTLKKDDVIKYTGKENQEISFTLDNIRKTTPATSSKSYIVEETLNGKSTIYIWRASGSSTYLKTLTIERGEVVTTKIAEDKLRTYATHIAAADLDFTAVEDQVEAYIATGLSGTDAVAITKVSQVPEGTPIIIKSSTPGATVYVPLAASTVAASTVDGNLLVEGDGTTSVTESDGYYFISADQFHLANAGTLQSGKAYLHIVSPSRTLKIGFEDETTGIEELKNSKTEELKSYYNLNGQRVTTPRKGLYIVNGKKVIMK